MIKIVVDAMGGDNAPQEIVKGAVQALQRDAELSVVLTGDKAKIEPCLAGEAYDAARLQVVHCSEVITNDDVPTLAIRQKKDSSLVVALKMLKEDEEAQGFVSAGSTGAVLTGALLRVGRIRGISRPAVCPALPTAKGGKVFIIDAGANAECKPVNLCHFAIMGTAYAKAMGVKDPRVGLVTNGTEEHKGDPLHQETFHLLKKLQGINFVGNIEGRDIMYGDVDVAVADGFSGNIALKAIEGCGKTVAEMLKKEFTASFGRKLSYLVAKKPISGLSNALDYSRFGGSVFLGLKKVVVKSHGSSKAKSIKPSIYQAIDACKGGLIGMMEDLLAETSAQSENV